MSDVREDEATKGKTATVTWRGQKFVVPRERADWSLDLLEALEDGASVGIIRGFLGPVQWRKVKAMGLMAPEFDEFADALATSLGFGSTGESPASVA